MVTRADLREYASLRNAGHSHECASKFGEGCSCALQQPKPPRQSDADRARAYRERHAAQHKAGRPRKFASNAERQAAYRRRKLETAEVSAITKTKEML